MSRIYALLLTLFLFHTFNAQHVITRGFNSSVIITKGISFLEDKESKMDFNQVLRSGAFTPITTDVPNFGISNSSFWLKITVRNESDLEFYRLQVSQPGLDEIDFYHPLENGDFTILKGGEVLHFNAREFFDPNYIFRVRIPHHSTSEFYIRLKSWDNLKVPITIGTQEAVFESNKVRDFVFGIFAGIMVVMFLYNGFLYVTVRDKTYLYYILYLAAVIFVQVSIQGYTFQYLWPFS